MAPPPRAGEKIHDAASMLCCLVLGFCVRVLWRLQNYWSEFSSLVSCRLIGASWVFLGVRAAMGSERASQRSGGHSQPLRRQQRVGPPTRTANIYYVANVDDVQ